jgi:hypothetical protein
MILIILSCLSFNTVVNDTIPNYYKKELFGLKSSGVEIVNSHFLKGVRLDGDDYVHIPQDSFFTLPTSAFTAMIYAKVESVANWQCLVSKWYNNDSICSFWFGFTDSSELTFALNTDNPPSYYTMKKTSSWDEYHLFTATYDGLKMRVYIDSLPFDSTAYDSAIIDSDGQLLIGASYAGEVAGTPPIPQYTNHLNGIVDEVILWDNKVLSLSEIKDYFVFFNKGVKRKYGKVNLGRAK